MDLQPMQETMRKLQAWRNQFIGMGLLLPDLAALIQLVEDDQGQVAALKEEKAKLTGEVETLRTAKTRYADEEAKYREALEAAKRQMADEQAACQCALHDVKQRVADEQAELDAAHAAAVAARQAELQAVIDEIADQRQLLAKVKAEFEKFKKQHGL